MQMAIIKIGILRFKKLIDIISRAYLRLGSSLFYIDFHELLKENIDKADSGISSTPEAGEIGIRDIESKIERLVIGFL